MRKGGEYIMIDQDKSIKIELLFKMGRYQCEKVAFSVHEIGTTSKSISR